MAGSAVPVTFPGPPAPSPGLVSPRRSRTRPRGEAGRPARSPPPPSPPGSCWPPAGPVRRAAGRRGEGRGRRAGRPAGERAGPEETERTGRRRRIPGRAGSSPPPSSSSSSSPSRGEWSRRCRPGWDPPADTAPGTEPELPAPPLPGAKEAEGPLGCPGRGALGSPPPPREGECLLGSQRCAYFTSRALIPQPRGLVLPGEG